MTHGAFFHSYHFLYAKKFITCIFLSYSDDGKDTAHQSIVSVPCGKEDQYEAIILSKAIQHLKVDHPSIN